MNLRLKFIEKTIREEHEHIEMLMGKSFFTG